MDFKVCGTGEGITSIQMDIKIGGVDRAILEKALAQAQRKLSRAAKGTPERARRRKVVGRVHERADGPAAAVGDVQDFLLVDRVVHRLAYLRVGEHRQVQLGLELGDLPDRVLVQVGLELRLETRQVIAGEPLGTLFS